MKNEIIIISLIGIVGYVFYNYNFNKTIIPQEVIITLEPENNNVTQPPQEQEFNNGGYQYGDLAVRFIATTGTTAVGTGLYYVASKTIQQRFRNRPIPYATNSGSLSLGLNPYIGYGEL